MLSFLRRLIQRPPEPLPKPAGRELARSVESKGSLTEDEIPFIRAILASSLDPQPRLAYAEWLGTRGDPRADYIRSWVAINDPNIPAEERELHSARLFALHSRINRHWTSFISRLSSPNDEGPAGAGSDGNSIDLDARLGYGPCAICGRRANRTDWVSRMPCVRCGRVLCWECADTGVHGSLPDFRHFVTGSFSVGGYRLGWDSCPFCQDADWMSTHGG